jgi:nitrate reductase gamma subunit
MRKLLTLKHWHLFLLIFICGAWTSPSPYKEIINSIAIVTFSLWIYAIGVYGQERIAELGLNPMNVRLFKINVLIVGVFFLIGLFFFSNGEPTTSDTIKLKDIPLILGVLYLFFAIFQTIVFTCKTIAKIESRKEVSFGDYFINLLLMFFLFIGVWILQPKVNKFFTTNEEVQQ